jgi:lipid A ethanolaminephosphotransferase
MMNIVDPAAPRLRRAMPAWLLGLLVGGYMLALFNHQLWLELVNAFAATGGMQAHPLLALAMILRLLGSLVLTLALLLWPRIGKPLLAILLVVAAASAYFIDHFGVRLNEDVVQSVFETRQTEAAAMFTAGSVDWIGLLGVLPAILVLCIPWRFARPRRALVQRVLVVLAAVLMMLVPSWLAGRDFVYFYRNHRVMYEVFNPYAAISGTFQYLRRDVFHRERPLLAIGTDATMQPGAAMAAHKRVVVLVLGETARAQDFSLQGYARDTNPQMRRDDAIYFTHASSCGTATTVSVPCMFSNMTRARFDKPVAMSQWNLLDILQHAGVDVFWRDNDEGCKGVCVRVPNEDLTDARIAGLCDINGCLDQVLIDDLPQRLARMRSPALLVLHLRGSHGPAYYQRYPTEFDRFKPGCNTAEVQTCSSEQVVNSYDNTILYTDHILGKVVDALQSSPEVDSMMFYLSDHGESLGENNVYLHGADRDHAPSQQTHIPMLLWLSPGWQRDSGLQQACLDVRRMQPASQDNVFHTMLGLFDVRTLLYDKSLDLLAGCRP